MVCLLGVPAIGQEIDPSSGDDGPAILAQKAGRVGDIGRLCENQTTYSLLIQPPANRLDTCGYDLFVHPDCSPKPSYVVSSEPLDPFSDC